MKAGKPRVLLIRPGALGDTLMLLPALCDLRPATEAMVAGRRPGIDFLSGAAARTIDLEAAPWSRLFQEQPAPDGLQLPEGQPLGGIGLVVAFLRDPDGCLRRNLKTFLPGAEVHFFPSLPAKGARTHVASHAAACLKTVGLPVLPSRALAQARKVALIPGPASAIPRERIVLHPGSGSPRKNLPPEFWLELAGRVAQQTLGLKMTVLLGPAELERGPPFDVSGLEPVQEVCRCPESPALLQLLQEARLYLGHDSGITHLAAMTGAPTIALFRDSDPRQWAPLGPAVALLPSAKAGKALLRRVLSASERLLTCGTDPGKADRSPAGP